MNKQKVFPELQWSLLLPSQDHFGVITSTLRNRCRQLGPERRPKKSIAAQKQEERWWGDIESGSLKTDPVEPGIPIFCLTLLLYHIGEEGRGILAAVEQSNMFPDPGFKHRNIPRTCLQCSLLD